MALLQSKTKRKSWALSRPLLVIDIETSGLDPRNDSIVEIGACVLSKDLTEGPMFVTRVRPETEISVSAEAVHGLTAHDLQDAPDIREAIGRFDAFAPKDAVLSGHNVAFDIAFLRAAYERAGLPFQFDYHALDLWSVAFFVFGAQAIQTQSFDLNALCRAFGIQRDSHHSARQDVLVTAKILRHLYAVARGVEMEVLGRSRLFEDDE